eukprot:gene11846-14492_t
MAKVNLYISNDAYEKINAIIEKRRQEGAREKDVSFSATASMLLELGLRVHEAQMERKEFAFNQTEFNKLLLECVVKTQSSVAKILGIESLSPHVSGNPKFEYANMVEDIREKYINYVVNATLKFEFENRRCREFSPPCIDCP